MDKNKVIDLLTTKFVNDVAVIQDEHGMIVAQTDRENIISVLKYLKEDKELQFIYLTDITAVHYPGNEKDFVIVYHVHSLVHNIRIRIKVFLRKDDLSIPSATAVWNAANWMERETYDFYGINFVGHPDLRRILNMDELDVFPMRKEYPLEDPNKVDKKDFYFGR